MEDQVKETVKENGIAKIATALNRAQGIMFGAKKDKKNPFFKSNYADLASVFDAIREPFSCNGLSITQTMDILDNGTPVLKTRLMHASGEFIDSKMILPQDPNPQKLGSAITYMRRYALMAIAGIPAEDDDGNAAASRTPKSNRLTLENISSIENLINGYSDIREKVMKACAYDIGSITEDRYQNALDWINKMILEKSVEKMPKAKKVSKKDET